MLSKQDRAMRAAYQQLAAQYRTKATATFSGTMTRHCVHAAQVALELSKKC